MENLVHLPVVLQEAEQIRVHLPRRRLIFQSVVLCVKMSALILLKMSLAYVGEVLAHLHVRPLQLQSAVPCASPNALILVQVFSAVVEEVLARLPAHRLQLLFYHQMVGLLMAHLQVVDPLSANPLRDQRHHEGVAASDLKGLGSRRLSSNVGSRLN